MPECPSSCPHCNMPHTIVHSSIKGKWFCLECGYRWSMKEVAQEEKPSKCPDCDGGAPIVDSSDLKDHWLCLGCGTRWPKGKPKVKVIVAVTVKGKIK